MMAGYAFAEQEAEPGAHPAASAASGGRCQASFGTIASGEVGAGTSSQAPSNQSNEET